MKVDMAGQIASNSKSKEACLDAISNLARFLGPRHHLILILKTNYVEMLLESTESIF